jgi:hypothetical protein
VVTLNPKPEPNPNYPNCWSIRVLGFGFGPDHFIIQGSVSVSVPMVYNPNRQNDSKFSTVVYFDLQYECYNFVF